MYWFMINTVISLMHVHCHFSVLGYLDEMCALSNHMYMFLLEATSPCGSGNQPTSCRKGPCQHDSGMPLVYTRCLSPFDATKVAQMQFAQRIYHMDRHTGVFTRIASRRCEQTAIWESSQTWSYDRWGFICILGCSRRSTFTERYALGGRVWLHPSTLYWFKPWF